MTSMLPPPRWRHAAGSPCRRGWGSDAHATACSRTTSTRWPRASSPRSSSLRANGSRPNGRTQRRTPIDRTGRRMSRLPLALVGSGAMGRRHLRGLAALSEVGLLEFDLVAVCDLDPDAARAAADDAEELLGRRPAVF